jgi:hypothetical protein
MPCITCALNPRPVQDIDECATANCGPNARCTQPTVGNYQCVCNTGYDGTAPPNTPITCTVSALGRTSHVLMQVH